MGGEGERDLLELAMTQAHLPCLVATVAHLTGDMSLLRERWLPRYDGYADHHRGGLSDEARSEIAATARHLIPPLIGCSRQSFAAPPPEQLKAMMDFVAGRDIPEHYLPLLRAELCLEAPEPPATDRITGFKVLVVGAGMSGLLAGVALKAAGYDFRIIERRGDVGGTWNANTYPGCRVDSQSHLYCYSFHPNYGWPHRFSTQPALKAYFREVADHYGLWEHIRFETSLTEAAYQESTGTWTVRLENAVGTSETVEVNAVISAVGQLNRPKIPPFPGRERFTGPQFHSATWRDDVDLAGRHVAVVGTGASAFQLTPELAKVAAHVSVFQRSAPWFAPTLDYHWETGEGQRWLFERLPYYAEWYRFWLFWTMTEGTMPALKADPDWGAVDGSISAANQRIRSALLASIREQVGHRKDLLDKVIPTAPFGGKRTLRDNGQWIRTLKRDNVDLVTEPIREIGADCVVTVDGCSRRVDAIIYGTGFEASRFLEPARIHGRGGVELNEWWDGDPSAYLGMTVPAFPNFFMVYGPNTNLVAQGSIVFFSECSVHYIVRSLDMLRARGAKALEPKPGVYRAYNEWVDGENARMAWGLPGVTNWYKSESGRVSQNWPFPLVDYWNLTRNPDPDDYVFSGSREAR